MPASIAITAFAAHDAVNISTAASVGMNIARLLIAPAHQQSEKGSGGKRYRAKRAKCLIFILKIK